jgi:hypothetical protein
MFRRTTVILLIATILACPFRCGGMLGAACAEARAGVSEAPAGCACCRHESEPERSGNDCPTPQPCDCASCVCEGAVLPEKVEFVPDDATSMPLALVVHAGEPVNGPQLRCNPVPPADAELPSGRCMRVLHRSLLL